MYDSACSEIQALLLQGAQLVDVRTPAEFTQRALPGAVNLPLPRLERLSEQLDPERPVLVYCRNGQRSAHARHRLQSAGFKRVIDLGGPFYYLPCVPQIEAARKRPAIAA